jgi:ribulose-phosphate 3-epimerase
VQRVLKMIRERGALAALALNPATPLMMAQEVLPDIDMLLVMTVNPGFAGQKLVVQCLDKIKRARQMMDDAGYGEIPIEVDGNCSFENVVTMERAGASIFVVGSSSVFHPEFGITKGMQKLRDSFIR